MGAGLVGCSDADSESDEREVPTLTQSPSTGTPTTTTSSTPSGEAVRAPQVLGTAATGLEAPWGLAFLPGGDAVVTERDSGRVLLLDGQGGIEELGTIDAAAPEGEGGLLGVAASPAYSSDRTLFLYATTETDNRVLRVQVDGDRLGEPETILDGIPSGFIHDGGRLAFGPDGFLYVSTGETGERELSQDRDSLAGKILRITTDGAPAPGNPFDSPVWSWGHRNVQGLAFDDGERLWASEFGDSSVDELNLIERGANYGWPEVEGPGGGFTDPQQTWPVSDASPSGLAYAEGALWMAGLRGNRLWRIPVTGDRTGSPQAFFVGEYGRLRTVVAAPDGTLWVTTSNTDGRGEPSEDDDRILVLRP